MVSNLNLKGIWIPAEILLDSKLSDKEKIIYSIIIFLSKEKQYCYCTNKTFSELLNISITQVSKLINSLKSKKYIDIKIKIILKYIMLTQKKITILKIMSREIIQT